VRSACRAAGRSVTYIFGLWSAITILSGAAAALGAAFLGGAAAQVVATASAVAAGALLTMVVNTIVPEAAEGEQRLAGVLVVVGLLAAFTLSNVGET
jgi:zinc transporter, ZIP family